MEIIDFEPRYAADFERLNVEWLKKYFRVEAIDRKILGDPQRYIVGPGGAIVFARDDGTIVGTCALKPCGDGVFELTKMAVTANVQGRGLGRTLLAAAIDRYQRLGGTRLFLESHDSLAAALHLYESVGFVHETPAKPSPYVRANVYMVYRPG